MVFNDAEQRHRAREARRAERARRRAERRQRHHAGAGEAPKERVLHTRISHQLADEIRKVAGDLRVPVSNLVRNVLEEAFSVVETVSENVGEILEDILDEAEAARDRYRARAERSPEPGEAAEETPAEAAPERPRPEFPEVLGWQPLVLNRQAACADCGTPLGRGERAFVGIGPAVGATPAILCSDCTDARA